MSSDTPQATLDLPTYLTTAELAAVTRSPESTVRYWRHVGSGPTFTRVGRRVLYDRAVVMRWLAARSATTTGEAA